MQATSATHIDVLPKVDVLAFEKRHKDDDVNVVIESISDARDAEWVNEEGFVSLIVRVPIRYMRLTNNPDLLIDFFYRKAKKVA